MRVFVLLRRLPNTADCQFCWCWRWAGYGSEVGRVLSVLSSAAARQVQRPSLSLSEEATDWSDYSDYTDTFRYCHSLYLLLNPAMIRDDICQYFPHHRIVLVISHWNVGAAGIMEKITRVQPQPGPLYCLACGYNHSQKYTIQLQYGQFGRTGPVPQR